jgi:hypothetical protein
MNGVDFKHLLPLIITAVIVFYNLFFFGSLQTLQTLQKSAI